MGCLTIDSSALILICSTSFTVEALASVTGVPVLLLSLPWLNPLTYGPTHPVVQWLVVWLGAILCWLIWSVAHTDAEARIKLIAKAWLLAAMVSACMGLLQYLGYAAQFSPWVNFVDVGQAYANLRQRNQLATLLAIGLSALLWWQVAGSQNVATRAESLAQSGFAAAIVILLVAADAATASRTGMLQLLALLALGFVWRRGRRTLLWAVTGYAFAALVLPRLIALAPLQSGILGRISEEASVCGSRLTLWSNVLHLIAQKPWLGWGWGELRFAHFVTLYSGDRFCEILGNAHNLPLQLAVEMGIPFALAVCGVLMWLTVRAKPWRERDATRQMAWSVLAVIGLHSLLEYPLWYGPFQLAAVLAVWMLWQSRPSRAHSTDIARTVAAVTAPALSMAIAVVMIAACSYAAWDYWRISQIYLPVSQRAAQYRDDTLTKIRPSWLFADQVQFAELGTTALTAENAEHINLLAKEVLHFSPEASVVQKLIESAILLGQMQEAAYYQQRFQAAYPQEYAAWLATRSDASHKAP